MFNKGTVLLQMYQCILVDFSHTRKAWIFDMPKFQMLFFRSILLLSTTVLNDVCT